MQTSNHKELPIFTIGHSTRPLADFIAILKAYCIQEVIDIRTIARSRHNPQFNAEELEHSLKQELIGYKHMIGLGGLRHTKADSLNTAWHNRSFRGFADYMQTTQFQDALAELIKLAQLKQIVIMCAEAVPWRCHRSLIGDALLAHNIVVNDIFSLHQCKVHQLTPWAVVHEKQVTYPKSALKKAKSEA